MPVSTSPYSEITLSVTIAQARGLVAKDRALLNRKRTTSDPYLQVFVGSQSIGKTAVIPKNCENPVWNAVLQHTWMGAEVPQLLHTPTLKCVILDHDALDKDDPMGIVEVPLQQVENLQWYTVQAGAPSDKYHCHNACGELQVSVQWKGRAVTQIARGNQISLASHAAIQVGLAWDIQTGVGAVDLDSSVVAVDRNGNVDMNETVYFANLHNPNRSLVHSGDDTTGDGGGDDETIVVNLQQIPSKIVALYFVLTVATPGKTLSQVTSAAMQFLDAHTHKLICRYMPANESENENTALVMVRLGRGMDQQWTCTPINDGFGYARDFGSLIPELKGYTRDLVPNIRIDPTERVAILRKGGTIRVTDYLPGHILPPWLTFGLAWDLTDGVNIDLDASAILLDENFEAYDTVWFRHLETNGGSVKHSGDEREGDEAGDDEKIKVNLKAVPRNVEYICFVLNSFSGQELDDVSKASCHLFDPETRTEVAKYAMTNAQELNRHTALMVACLYRPEADNDWRLWILAQPSQGRTVEDNIPDVAHYLRTHTPPPVTPPISAKDEDEIAVTAMPTEVETIEEEEIVVIPMKDLVQNTKP